MLIRTNQIKAVPNAAEETYDLEEKINGNRKETDPHPSQGL